MTKVPEQIWIQSDHIPSHVALDRIDEQPDADEAHQFTSYTRTDVAQAMVAAAHDVMAQLADSRRDACGLDQDGNPYVSEEAHIFGGNVADNIACNIRALTPTDAKAALDRVVQEAVKEALQVKPITFTKPVTPAWWGSTPFGIYVVARCVYDDAPDAWCFWRPEDDEEDDEDAAGKFTSEAAALEAAQADYEARIRSALKGGEA